MAEIRQAGAEARWHGAPPRGIALLLRAEGAAVAGLCVWAYTGTDAGWWMFLLFILAPDLSMLGYLAGPRAGAWFYNAAHSYLAPAALFVLLYWLATGWALPLALIWTAHIGFDRLLGYGLKHGDGFRHTHLGLIGRG